MLRDGLLLEKMLAGSTGLEPAASAVTGQRSNQLNYVPFCCESGRAENQPDHPAAAKRREQEQKNAPLHLGRI